MRLILSSLALLALVPALHAQVPGYVPTNGLVGWWPFNGNANDESGNGNNGTVSGPTLSADRFGVADNSYYFNNNGNITIQTLQFQNYVNSGFTISYWFNMEDSIQSALRHFLFSNYDGINGLQVEYYPGQSPSFRHSLRTGSANPPEINYNHTFTNASSWKHAVFIWNPPTLTTYINGQMVNQSSNSGITNLSVCCSIITKFGSQWNNTSPHKGKIDDIGVWSRVLSPAEIQALFNTGQPPSLCISPDPVSFTGLNSSYTTSDGPATLTGSPSGGVFIGPGVTGSTFSPAAAGEGTHSISYTYLDGNNCVNTFSLCTSVALGMGVEPGGNALEGVRVFPNPNRGQFTVEMELNGLVSMQVFDARGRQVHNEVFTAYGARTQRSLDLSTLAKGSYTLQVQNNGGRLSQTVVVE